MKAGAAAPERGRANDALIALLAREWRMPKGRIRVSAAATSRRKTVTVKGPPEALLATLHAWAANRRG